MLLMGFRGQPVHESDESEDWRCVKMYPEATQRGKDFGFLDTATATRSTAEARFHANRMEHRVGTFEDPNCFVYFGFQYPRTLAKDVLALSRAMGVERVLNVGAAPHDDPLAAVLDSDIQVEDILVEPDAAQFLALQSTYGTRRGLALVNRAI